MSLLDQECLITSEQIFQLFNLLPHDSSPENEGSSFSAGAYARGCLGLRESCVRFPRSVQAFNRFAKQQVHEPLYTSFAVLQDKPRSWHTDRSNAYLPSVAIPVTKFTGGHIAVKLDAKEVFLDVAKGPVSFCSRLEHRTCARQGARVVLVLYSLKDAAKLSPQEKSILDSLGFPRPSPQQLECKRIPQPTGVNTQRPATPVPLPGCNSLPRQGPGEGANQAMPRDIDADGQAPKLREVCAGSAILSATAINLGWHAVPLDQASCRFKPLLRLSFWIFATLQQWTSCCDGMRSSLAIGSTWACLVELAAARVKGLSLEAGAPGRCAQLMRCSAYVTSACTSSNKCKLLTKCMRQPCTSCNTPGKLRPSSALRTPLAAGYGQYSQNWSSLHPLLTGTSSCKIMTLTHACSEPAEPKVLASRPPLQCLKGFSAGVTTLTLT